MDFATVVPPYVAKPLRLRPFRAVMLAPGRVGDPASARALARPYRDVARRLTEWVEEGRARQDAAPAIYLHEYTSGGLVVRGLVGTLTMSGRARAPEERAVWPHEEVHPEQVGELAARMAEMGLNPAPILLVHDGEQGLRDLVAHVSERDPDWSYLDRAGQRQRLWAVREKAELDQIDAGLATSRCLVADGHHRYAAYLQLQEEHPGTPWDSGLAMLVDQGDTPLFLGAIHRVLQGTSLDALTRVALELGAHVTELSRTDALARLGATCLVLTDGLRWYCVRPAAQGDRALVEWLHERWLPALPGSQLQIGYHHSVEDTLARTTVTSPSVLLPTLDFAQVRSIVESGRLLPEKATSFQPKPSLGVLMRPVHDG